MKRLLLAAVLGSFVITNGYAQVSSDNQSHSFEAKSKRWQVANIGLQLSPYGYNFPNITLQGLTSLSVRPGAIGHHLRGFKRTDYYNVDVVGSYIGAYVALNPRSRRLGTINTQQELRLGVAFAPGREAMIDYERPNPSGEPFTSDFISYCLVENELVLSGAYLFKTTWGPKQRMKLYAGPGVQLSSTFNNLLFIISSSVNNLETGELGAKASQYAKAYLQAGFSYEFTHRLAFSLETSRGIGMQIVHGGKNNLIGNFWTINLGLQYQF